MNVIANYRRTTQTKKGGINTKTLPLWFNTTYFFNVHFLKLKQQISQFSVNQMKVQNRTEMWNGIQMAFILAIVTNLSGVMLYLKIELSITF